MTDLEKLRQVANDVSYDINGVWDGSIEEDSELITILSKILDKCDDELKNDLIDIIKHYIVKMYEEMGGKL